MLGGLRKSVGVGFRWLSPIGPLRFEWGLPLDLRPGREASGPGVHDWRLVLTVTIPRRAAIATRRQDRSRWCRPSPRECGPLQASRPVGAAELQHAGHAGAPPQSAIAVDERIVRERGLDRDRAEVTLLHHADAGARNDVNDPPMVLGRILAGDIETEIEAQDVLRD